MIFDPYDWYWIVGRDETRAWSSAENAYVEKWDMTRTTRIANEQTLGEVLMQYNLTGPVVIDAQVQKERDRQLAACWHDGHWYDFDSDSQTNIAGAGSLAIAAMAAGARPGDYRWADPESDFYWLDANNERVLFDAQGMFAFAAAAAMWKRHHIYKARVIKDMTPVPTDYKDEKYWV